LSRALKNAKYEKYCRLRASAQPRLQAYREAGWETSGDDDAYSNACRLERRPGVRERIEYLSHQDEELIAEKRRRIEEALWSMHEADIGDCFETYETAKVGRDGKIETDEDGKMLTVRKQRPRLLSDLPPDVRKTIEDVSVDKNGNVIPKLYSRLQANAELRKMHHIGRTEDQTDISRLSDAELIAQLAEQAKQLGIEIDLNYSFAQPAPSTDAASGPTEVNGDQVIDNDSAPTAATDVSSNPPELTSELSVRSAAPPEARRLPKAGRGKR
jgi:hypothetical protein